jgi:hypothetical protein
MGTSGPYTPSPKWSGIKTDITNALNSGPVTDQDAHDLVSDFVQQLCNEPDEGFGDVPPDFGHLTPDQAEEKLAPLVAQFPKITGSPPPPNRGRGGGGGGGGAKVIKGRPKGGGGAKGGGRGGRLAGGAVRPAAQRLATFISQIPKVGLRQALIDAGVPNVDQLPPEQIALAIADVLATDASLIVQTELRAALTKVLERVCEEPASIEAAEEMFTNSAYDLQTVIQMLFECYIMERFLTFFCEHEAPKHGYDAADKIAAEARDYVASEMQLEKAERRDLTSVDWASAEGAKIVDGILGRTVAIYTDL